MKKRVFNEFGQDRIIIYDIDGKIEFETPAKLHNYHLLMLTEGEITIDVNYRVFKMKPMSSIHLSAGDMTRSISPGKGLKGFHLIFSPEFQNEIRTTRKSPISIQLKKEFPYQEFNEEEYDFLIRSVDRLCWYMDDPTHNYQSIVIKNTIHNLLLDISDKRRKQHGNMMMNADHHEVIRERFRNLLAGHSEEHHSVNWYAEAMMISTDYLSKIIREHDGSSARVWINRSIIDKAKFMMKQSDLTLKEISDRLHFPDQSSFGRFFKSNTGQSPKEFRKGLTGNITE